MTLDAWNLLFSAGTCALLTVGAFWFKFVVDQQLKSLNAIIQLKDAEISALRGEAAPAITRAYAEMRQHANVMTEDVQHISEELKEVRKKYEASLYVLDKETEAASRAERGSRPFYESNGLLLAANILSEKVSSQFSDKNIKGPIDLVNKFFDAYEEALGLIRNEIQSRNIHTAELIAESMSNRRLEGNR